MHRFYGLILVLAVGFSFWFVLSRHSPQFVESETRTTFWEMQAFDTTKLSRDLAREKNTSESFQREIISEMEVIASAGATHVALGTPYDEEFIPFMKSWVSAARANGLKIWFRGNWSGWEGWFEYPLIARAEHVRLTEQYILTHPELFESGDIFSACTECENGGPGDPRANEDLAGHREFLISEYSVTKQAFQRIGKSVKSNYMPMNADVAELVMDMDTTRQLGGVVVIDHYAADPKQYAQDIRRLAESSGGEIILGEFGAPIDSIHGEFTDEQQAQWIEEVLSGILPIRQLIGVNYWVATGGETELWSEGIPKPGAAVITKYYRPSVLQGSVKSEVNNPVKEAVLESGIRRAVSDQYGNFKLPFISSDDRIVISAEGYTNHEISLADAREEDEIVLQKNEQNLFYQIFKIFI